MILITTSNKLRNHENRTVCPNAHRSDYLVKSRKSHCWNLYDAPASGGRPLRAELPNPHVCGSAMCSIGLLNARRIRLTTINPSPQQNKCMYCSLILVLAYFLLLLHACRCLKQSSRYTCPRCNTPYCTLACYKSDGHLNCSETFYKENFLQALKETKGR